MNFAWINIWENLKFRAKLNVREQKFLCAKVSPQGIQKINAGVCYINILDSHLITQTRIYFLVLRRADELKHANKRSSVETLNSQRSDDSFNELPSSPAQQDKKNARLRAKSMNVSQFGTLKG